MNPVDDGTAERLPADRTDDQLFRSWTRTCCASLTQLRQLETEAARRVDLHPDDALAAAVFGFTTAARTYVLAPHSPDARRRFDRATARVRAFGKAL